MLFNKEDLSELLWRAKPVINDKPVEIVVNEIVDTSRWSIHYTLVFSYDGKFYQTQYSRGATESQDESPFEYDADMIECSEVVPVEVTKIEYVYV